MSLSKDHRGDLVAATLQPVTGELLTTRRKDEPGLALTAWQKV